MKTLVRIATPVLAITLLAGCKSATEVTEADLLGVWIASQARYSGLEDPKNNNVDLIDEGFSVTFASDGSGDYVIQLIDEEGESEFVTGTLTIDGTKIEFVNSEGVQGTGEVFLEGEEIAFSITGGIEVDFNDDGRETPARLLLVMDRESTEIPTPL